MTATLCPPRADVAALCGELQSLQRQRAVVMKSRIMQANRLQAVVAGTLGYAAGMPEKERKKKFAEAAALIRAVAEGKADHRFKAIILTTLVGTGEFDKLQAGTEKAMLRFARQLPVAAWVEAPEQNGFGPGSLAVVVGEAGDLANYANPAKVWKRLGCAPHAYAGVTQMPSTWRTGKPAKLPAGEWEAMGYSPRRRSIAYLIGENLMRGNIVRGGAGDEAVETELPDAGPYRARYLAARDAYQAAHADFPKLRCHRHGMLLATKLLLKNLWIEWNRPGGETRFETEAADAP
jgi:hypothetical protein